VHIKRIREARIINGRFLPESIRLATDEEFGKYAWAFSANNYDGAFKKFLQVAKQYKLFKRIEDTKYNL
jgi:hypothetical protein